MAHKSSSLTTNDCHCSSNTILIVNTVAMPFSVSLQQYNAILSVIAAAMPN